MRARPPSAACMGYDAVDQPPAFLMAASSEGLIRQPREDGDAGFRGAGGRHHDHARRAAQTNLLRQIG